MLFMYSLYMNEEFQVLKKTFVLNTIVVGTLECL